MKPLVWVALLALAVLPACSDGADAAPSNAQDQSVEGRPYTLTGTQVWTVPDPVSGRDYEVFVSLPASYADSPQRRYPVLYITDADYGFPLIRSISRRVNLEGPMVEEFILVGLSYARGETGAVSRARDYTPTPNGSRRNRDLIHGQSAAYLTYLQDQVLPYVEDRFRADPEHRIFMGHSFGGILGAEALLTRPGMFSAYILGSPSIWFDDRHLLKMEAERARGDRVMQAEVYMYIGRYEGLGPASDPRFNKTLDMVGDMALFEQRLKSRNYTGLTIASEVIDGEDHLTVFPTGLTHGLRHLLPDA